MMSNYYKYEVFDTRDGRTVALVRTRIVAMDRDWETPHPNLEL